MFKETLRDPKQNLRAFMCTDCTTHLKVWYEDGADMTRAEDIREFRFTYNMLEDPHGIIWRKKEIDGKPDELYVHVAIDDGEDKSYCDAEGHRHTMPVKQAPIVVTDGIFEKKHIEALAEYFVDIAKDVEPDLVRFIHEKILAFPEDQFVSPR